MWASRSAPRGADLTLRRELSGTKEAAGDLTGDKDLQREGKVDQASGEIKDKVGDAADKVKGLFNKDKK